MQTVLLPLTPIAKCALTLAYSDGEYAPRDPLLVQNLQKRGPCSKLFKGAKVFVVKFVVFKIGITTGHLDSSTLKGALLSISPRRFCGHCGHARRMGDFAPLRDGLARE